MPFESLRTKICNLIDTDEFKENLKYLSPASDINEKLLLADPFLTMIDGLPKYQKDVQHLTDTFLGSCDFSTNLLAQLKECIGEEIQRHNLVPPRVKRGEDKPGGFGRATGKVLGQSNTSQRKIYMREDNCNVEYEKPA